MIAAIRTSHTEMPCDKGSSNLAAACTLRKSRLTEKAKRPNSLSGKTCFNVVRGITVCSRWNDFQNFLDDVGPRPSPKHSLDRLNNNLGYFKENCRWATGTEQQRNRYDNRFFEVNGQKLTIRDCAKLSGIDSRTLYKKLASGHKMQDIIKLSATPLGPRRSPR